jgi:hypothetical protein
MLATLLQAVVSVQAKLTRSLTFACFRCRYPMIFVLLLMLIVMLLLMFALLSLLKSAFWSVPLTDVLWRHQSVLGVRFNDDCGS